MRRHRNHQLRPVGQGALLPVLHCLVGFAIDDHRRSLEQRQLVGDAVKFGLQIIIDQRAAVPSRDKGQIMVRQHLQASLLRELAPGLGADEPGLAGFGKADLKRGIAANWGRSSFDQEMGDIRDEVS